MLQKGSRGSQTLKDATNEAFRDWAASVETTFYVIGSVVGAHPYPYMVRQFARDGVEIFGGLLCVDTGLQLTQDPDVVTASI